MGTQADARFQAGGVRPDLQHGPLQDGYALERRAGVGERGPERGAVIPSDQPEASSTAASHFWTSVAAMAGPASATSKAAVTPARDLLISRVQARRSRAGQSDQRWALDVTHIEYGADGWGHLTAMIDCLTGRSWLTRSPSARPRGRSSAASCIT